MWILGSHDKWSTRCDFFLALAKAEGKAGKTSAFKVEAKGEAEGYTGAGEHIPTYRLVGTKFWDKDELKAKLGQNSSIVGTKFTSGLRVGTKFENVLPDL